jgi:hypothetical protein
LFLNPKALVNQLLYSVNVHPRLPSFSKEGGIFTRGILLIVAFAFEWRVP